MRNAMNLVIKNNPFNKSIAPYFFLCFAQLMVALNVIAGKLVVNHTSFLMAIFLRFSFATLIIFSLYFMQGDIKKSHFQLPKKHYLILLLQGLCAGLFFNLFLIMGLKYSSASMAGILISLLPAVIAVSAMLFLKEKLSTFQIVGIGLAFIGLWVINQGMGTTQTAHNWHEIIGVIFLLLALVPETAYYLLSKLHQNQLPVLVFAGLINAINVICILPLVLWYEPSAFSQLDNTTLEILFLSGAASAIFYTSWSLGIKHVSATKAGLLTALCPIMTVVIAALFLHEKITNTQMLGMFIVIASIILSNKKA